jgi:hypothetical protein
VPDLPPELRAEFDRLLAEQDLADLDGLMTYDGYFDELPLYSTYDQISFLDGYSPEERNKILIQAAVGHLPKILDHARKWYAGRDHDYFCMVSVTDWEYIDDGEPVVPRFLYGNPSRGYFDHAVFSPPASRFSEFTAEAIGPGYQLSEEVIEDNGRPRIERVFVQVPGAE